MDGQTQLPRSYTQQLKPEMRIVTGPDLSTKTLAAFKNPWPRSLVAPRVEELGVVVNYYPFIKDPVEDNGYYLSVKHSDGTIAIYYKSDLQT